jgi:hypothetical protein
MTVLTSLGLAFPEDTFTFAELWDTLGLFFFTGWTTLRDFCPAIRLCAKALAINIL